MILEADLFRKKEIIEASSSSVLGHIEEVSRKVGLALQRQK